MNNVYYDKNKQIINNKRKNKYFQNKNKTALMIKAVKQINNNPIRQPKLKNTINLNTQIRRKNINQTDKCFLQLNIVNPGK